MTVPRRAAAVALVCLTLGFGCTAKRAPAPTATGTASPAPGPTPSTLAFKVTSSGQGRGRVVLTERRRGRTVYVLHADNNVSDRFAAGQGRSVFAHPHVIFYQDHGKTLTADAPTATLEEQTKTVVMTGGVHARTEDGVTMTCDQLAYDDEHGMIHGKGNVVVTTPRGERLTGDTLDADVQLNHVRVTGAAAP